MKIQSVEKPQYDYDYLIIGSGFGGSVSAHRLTEKGYKVGVLEMGKRYRQKDYPKTNWNYPKFLWMPWIKFFGFFRMVVFKHAFVLSGVGVGGGSLVYANTLLVPPDEVWDDPKWKGLQDWKTLMPKFYQVAKHMLGVVKNPYLGQADRLLQQTSESEGFGESFYSTDVGIYFGEKGKTVPDPYFGGKGPDRTGCTLCGGCMVGCRHNAKNSLDKNYLYFAEKQGATVIPETRVIDVQPLHHSDGGEGYAIYTEQSTANFFKKRRVFYTRGVIFSAGVLGTMKLLLACKAKGSLPHLSSQIGEYVRTNSESIIGVRVEETQENDMSDGIAIGSGFHIDETTHVEACRYSKKSDALVGLTTPLPQGSTQSKRILNWLKILLLKPLVVMKVLKPSNWAKSTIILLVMQTLDNKINMRLKRHWFFPFKKSLATSGPKIPTYIPKANDFAQKMAKQTKGTPIASITEILMNIPTTAHILGGAAMGDSPESGVIDHRNRVFNYKNMYVCDGSMIGANLGVNPSLTITALTEHAMSYIPTKGEAKWSTETTVLPENEAQTAIEQKA